MKSKTYMQLIDEDFEKLRQRIADLEAEKENLIQTITRAAKAYGELEAENAKLRAALEGVLYFAMDFNPAPWIIEPAQEALKTAEDGDDVQS